MLNIVHRSRGQTALPEYGQRKSHIAQERTRGRTQAWLRKCVQLAKFAFSFLPSFGGGRLHLSLCSTFSGLPTISGTVCHTPLFFTQP